MMVVVEQHIMSAAKICVVVVPCYTTVVLTDRCSSAHGNAALNALCMEQASIWHYRPICSR